MHLLLQQEFVDCLLCASHGENRGLGRKDSRKTPPTARTGKPKEEGVPEGTSQVTREAQEKIGLRASLSSLKVKQDSR